jgi:predicted translin family RNA/ssDNA-binding protein
VNPWEFYGLGNEKKMEMMANGLKSAKANKADLDKQLDRFKRINDEVQKLKEKFAQWEAKE